MRTLLLYTLLFAASFPAAVLGADTDQALDQLQSDWILQEFVRDGEVVGTAKDTLSIFWVSGDWAGWDNPITHDHHEGKVSASIKDDAATFEITHPRYKTITALYDRPNDHTLRICFNEHDLSSVPSDFEAAKGSGSVLAVYHKRPSQPNNNLSRFSIVGVSGFGILAAIILVLGRILRG